MRGPISPSQETKAQLGFSSFSTPKSRVPPRRASATPAWCLLVIASPGEHLDKVRVVLADDSPHFGEIIRSTLGAAFHVVAAVSDGRQAMIAFLDLDPDLLITDLSMPYLNGIQLAHELRKAGCRTKITMLTMHNDPALISAALDARVSGYRSQGPALPRPVARSWRSPERQHLRVRSRVIKNNCRACRAAVVVAADRWPSTFMTALLESGYFDYNF